MAAHVRRVRSESKEEEGGDDSAGVLLTSSGAQPPAGNQEPQRARPGVTILAPAPARHPPPPLHRASVSPSLHTSHAKILQMHEYRERVQSACQSTYQFSLQAPRKPAAAAQDDRRRRAKSGYCRARVLATTKQFFHARESSSSRSSAPVGHGVDRVLPRTSGAHVNFHQMTSRRDEFLFGDRAGRRPRTAHDGDRAVGIAKDHFALGPGQYDVASARPATTATFSPSDRFHETFSTAQLGPGQYLASDELTTPRAAAAVFSQTPRRTDAALLSSSPAANTVSSYYYAPASSFLDRNAPHNGHQPSWPRAPRLSSQRRTTASLEAQQLRAESDATDYVERNRAAVEQQRAVQRIRSARELQGRLEPGRRRRRRREPDGGSDSSAADDDGSDDGDSASAPAPLLKRRSSIFYDADAPAPQSEQLRHALAQEKDVRSDLAVRGLVTLATVSAFSARLARTFHLVSVLRHITRAEQLHTQRVVFGAWRQLERAHSPQHAARVIVANSLRLRVRLRIRRKRAHVALLRQFLGGLSLDVQFALAMKAVKRKVQLLQRWWRHVQLMVRAREEALYHKWVGVETRLRLEHLNQLPHLQRVFQQPASAASSVPSDAPLHKLLNLPEQQRWFAAHFVLSADGCLRGYSASELVVEVKSYRSTFHEGGAAALQALSEHASARWKPFVMVFRPGAFRFVLLAAASAMPTEILAWRDRLERVAMAPTAGASNSDHLRLPTVGDFVEVSLQSGILAPATSSRALATPPVTTSASAQLSSVARNSAAPRGKLQARVRSIRQRHRAALAVGEGELAYYVVDLLKDFPRVPAALVWQTIRDKLREKRKSFRAALYRYDLELFHFRRHQEQTQHVRVLDKFREFFTLERPRRPHFRSLVSTRKMELLIRQRERDREID